LQKFTAILFASSSVSILAKSSSDSVIALKNILNDSGTKPIFLTNKQAISSMLSSTFTCGIPETLTPFNAVHALDNATGLVVILYFFIFII